MHLSTLTLLLLEVDNSGTTIINGPSVAGVLTNTGMSALSVVTTTVGGALGGMAGELQGVSALALMGCSDPATIGRFGAYRALSPVAVQDSFAGVILGNCLLTAGVCVVLVLRFCRRGRVGVNLGDN